MSGIITPEAALSYPKIETPGTDERTGDDVYSAALVFPPDTDLKELKQAAFQVVIEKFGQQKAKEMLKSGEYRFVGGPYHTFRTDAVAKGYEEGSVFINAKRRRSQPGIVDGMLNPVNPAALYPGIIVRASVNPYWYDTGTNKGVSWGLNNIQVLRDGERLDGRVAAEDEFDPVEDAVADLSDLTEEDGGGEDPFDELVGAGAGAESSDEGDLDLDALLG